MFLAMLSAFVLILSTLSLIAFVLSLITFSCSANFLLASSTASVFLSMAFVLASIASALSLMSSFISEILLLRPEIDLSCALSAASSFSKRSLAALTSVAELYLVSRSATLLVNSVSFASKACFAVANFPNTSFIY